MLERRAARRYDPESLALAGKLVELHPEVYTVWNYRREALQSVGAGTVGKRRNAHTLHVKHTHPRAMLVAGFAFPWQFVPYQQSACSTRWHGHDRQSCRQESQWASSQLAAPLLCLCPLRSWTPVASLLCPLWHLSWR